MTIAVDLTHDRARLQVSRTFCVRIAVLVLAVLLVCAIAVLVPAAADAQPPTPTPTPTPTPGTGSSGGGGVTEVWDGVEPDFSIFGVEFNNWRKIALGGAWALGFFVLAVYSIYATATMAMANRQGHAADAVDRTRVARWSWLGVFAMVALPTIWLMAGNAAPH